MSIISKVAGAALVVSVVSGAALSIYRHDGAQQAGVSQQENISEDYYIIKEHNSKIALFREGENEPMVIFEIPSDLYGAADTALLKEGIRLKGFTEVARLIEDLELE